VPGPTFLSPSPGSIRGRRSHGSDRLEIPGGAQSANVARGPSATVPREHEGPDPSEVPRPPERRVAVALRIPDGTRNNAPLPPRSPPSHRVRTSGRRGRRRFGARVRLGSRERPPADPRLGAGDSPVVPYGAHDDRVHADGRGPRGHVRTLWICRPYLGHPNNRGWLRSPILALGRSAHVRGAQAGPSIRLSQLEAASRKARCQAVLPASEPVRGFALIRSAPSPGETAFAGRSALAPSAGVASRTGARLRSGGRPREPLSRSPRRRPSLRCASVLASPSSRGGRLPGSPARRQRTRSRGTPGPPPRLPRGGACSR
jgi:hypothetical protein